jgi:hypothetical protein
MDTHPSQTLPNSFYETTISQKSKPEKDTHTHTQRKIQADIPGGT